MKLISKMAMAALLLFVAFAISGTAGAQEFRGTLSGQVNDPTGAAVPGASVTVREVHTGTTNRTKSDAAGQYVVPFLLPGQYQISVDMAGFQNTVQNNVNVEAQAHPIVNITLQIGEATQTVTVESTPPLMDQANASVGQVIPVEAVEDLPLNGRTPTTLAALSEGVITTAAPQIVHPYDNNAGNSWSIGGTPNQVSEVLLDGSPDLTLLGALAYAPTQDSVQEVSVRPFDTDASFGHTIGGVINQITKSGTNRLHGSIYEFYQPSNLNANTYFNNRTGQPTPSFHYNQYGLTVGGPVWIPHVINGKDKMFFFFAWEALKNRSPATQLLTVPTAAERTGDFSALLAAGCPAGFNNDPTKAAAVCNAYGANKGPYVDPYQLYNPYTSAGTSANFSRTPVLNNQLSSVANFSVNPVAAAYLALYPQPNIAGAAADQSNYVSNAPSIDTYNNEFGRLDFNVSSRDHLFGDFRHNYRTQVKNNFFGNGITGTTLLRENFGLTLDNVFTLNPTTIIDTRVNWTYFNEVHGTPGAYTPSSVGLDSLAAGSQLQQLPFINFGTTSSCGSYGDYTCLGDTGSSLDPTTSYQTFVDMVKTLGRHTLKVGFDGRRYLLQVQNFGASSGTFTFNSSFTNVGNTKTQSIGGTSYSSSSCTFGCDLAAFEFGLPSSGSFQISSRADYYQYYVGAFVQDDWRVNSKLTLNMGLRFDIDTPFREKHGATVNGFNPTASNMLSSAAYKATTSTANGVTVSVPTVNLLGGLTFPGTANGAVYNNNSGFLSPRIGFSLSVTPKTVMRGGFGVFVQPETLSSLAATGTYSSSAISNQEGFSQATPYVSSLDQNFTPPTNTLSNPFPGGFTPVAGSSAGASTYLGQSISFLAPYQHDPYSERWDFGFQHSLTNSMLLEALYVGNHSLHLPVASQNLNAVLPQFLSYTPYRNQALANAIAQTSITNPFKGLDSAAGSLNSSSTLGLGNFIVPYPQFGTNAVNEQNQTIGSSNFNSLILHLEQRKWHGLFLTANYSFSKLLESTTFLNDQDNHLTYRVSPFDHTQHFTVGGTYELPFGRGKMFAAGGSRWMDEIVGGWVLNSIYQFQTGAPIEFSSDLVLQPGVSLRQITVQPRNTSPVGSATPAIPTGLFVSGSSANATACPSAGACDGSVFINNASYYNHYRTLPQTLSWVRQDGFNNLDASVLKNFHFTESSYLQLRFETFNTLNHPVFAAPNVSSPTSSNFGYITSTISNSLPRQIQLGGRIVF